MSNQPAWVTRGKTIRQLIQELRTFSDQDLEVRISIDGGKTHKPISLVGKRGGKAVLSNNEIKATVGRRSRVKAKPRS